MTRFAPGELARVPPAEIRIRIYSSGGGAGQKEKLGRTKSIGKIRAPKSEGKRCPAPPGGKLAALFAGGAPCRPSKTNSSARQRL